MLMMVTSKFCWVSKNNVGDLEQPKPGQVGEPVSTGLLHVVTLTDLDLNPI